MLRPRSGTPAWLSSAGTPGIRPAHLTTNSHQTNFNDPVTDTYASQGRDLLGSDGEKIGSVKETYEDERTGNPEWALVTTGLFGSHSHFVPQAGAEPAGEDVTVRVSKDQVKDAPSIQRGRALTAGRPPAV